MYATLEDNLSVLYEAISDQLIDQIYFEEDRLTNEDIENIKLAREEHAYYKWLDKQEYDRCACY